MSITQNDFFQENEGSDSEGMNSYAGDDGDYQPISALSGDDDDDDVEGDSDDEIPTQINGQDLVSHLGELNSVSFQTLPSMENNSNGQCSVENGVSNLNLTSDEEEEGEAEEERMRRASELAISQAFRDDESRRSAPLTPENASRIVNAMRGISFPGFPPDWAGHVPEHQWMDRLRRLREPTRSRN